MKFSHSRGNIGWSYWKKVGRYFRMAVVLLRANYTVHSYTRSAWSGPPGVDKITILRLTLPAQCPVEPSGSAFAVRTHEVR
jgi:hypothetical protein